MLAEVVATAELLAAVGALERLLVSVKRAVVALEVLLATETAGAESTDKGLGWIFGEGLLASAASGVSGRCSLVFTSRAAGGG